MSDTATMTDARPAFVRTEPVDAAAAAARRSRRDRLGAREPVLQPSQHRC